tara:strand:- start:66 stop:575 length:510 start_codon:yes stop_codon:yes gene_type:complete
MSKKQLYNFLEINRLDKGLFRIWIVCSLVFYFIFYYIIFSEKVFKDFRATSKFKGFCTTSVLFNKLDTKLNLPEGSFLISRVAESGDGIRIVRDTEYWRFLGFPKQDEVYQQYTNVDVFKNEKFCKQFMNGPKNEFLLLFFIITIIPIAVVILWFFLKKTFIWIYRGFK